MTRTCKSVAVAGLKPLSLAFPANATSASRIEVVADLRAEANRKRRTVVRQEAMLAR